MYDFTLTTPERAYRVRARSAGQIERAALDVGLTPLGVHRDGDEFVYVPEIAGKRPRRERRRETAISRAFGDAGVAA